MGGSINQNVLSDLKVEDPMGSMLRFAHERQQVYHRKEKGHSWPWSSDPVLQKYKFCNVFRDQDRTTKWIVDWVRPINDSQTMFTNLVYARMCNNPEIMSQSGFIGDMPPEDFIALIDKIGGGKTKAKVNKNTVWKDPYQIAGAFKKKLDLPYREHVIAHHLPKVSEQLFSTVLKHKGADDLTDLLEALAVVWGYRMTMVFTHALLDLSYFRPDLVSPNVSYPLGDGATPVLNLLNHPTLDDIVGEWSKRYPDERRLLRPDAETILCEWRKYLVWSNNLAKKYRLYKRDLQLL